MNETPDADQGSEAPEPTGRTPEPVLRATAIGHLPDVRTRLGSPVDQDHAMTHMPWKPATYGDQPCLATIVTPEGEPDFGRGAYVLFPNQEECIFAERDEHVSRHSYALREPFPWAELHGLRDFKDVFVIELHLANIDPFREALDELERRAAREDRLEQEWADAVRELAEVRRALRAAAAALEARGASEAASAARGVAGPEPGPIERDSTDDEDGQPF